MPGTLKFAMTIEDVGDDTTMESGGSWIMESAESGATGGSGIIESAESGYTETLDDVFIISSRESEEEHASSENPGYAGENEEKHSSPENFRCAEMKHDDWSLKNLCEDSNESTTKGEMNDILESPRRRSFPGSKGTKRNILCSTMIENPEIPFSQFLEESDIPSSISVKGKNTEIQRQSVSKQKTKLPQIDQLSQTSSVAVTFLHKGKKGKSFPIEVLEQNFQENNVNKVPLRIKNLPSVKITQLNNCKEVLSKPTHKKDFYEALRDCGNTNKIDENKQKTKLPKDRIINKIVPKERRVSKIPLPLKRKVTSQNIAPSSKFKQLPKTSNTGDLRQTTRVLDKVEKHPARKALFHETSKPNSETDISTKKIKENVLEIIPSNSLSSTIPFEHPVERTYIIKSVERDRSNPYRTVEKNKEEPLKKTFIVDCGNAKKSGGTKQKIKEHPERMITNKNVPEEEISIPSSELSDGFIVHSEPEDNIRASLKISEMNSEARVIDLENSNKTDETKQKRKRHLKKTKDNKDVLDEEIASRVSTSELLDNFIYQSEPVDVMKTPLQVTEMNSVEDMLEDDLVDKIKTSKSKEKKKKYKKNKARAGSSRTKTVSVEEDIRAYKEFLKTIEYDDLSLLKWFV